MREIYEKQVRLLLEVLPFLRHEWFALKGGTAINFFYRNVPRLSVDIDLTYLPIKNRQDSYNDINEFLAQAQSKLEKRGYFVRQTKFDLASENKLIVSRGKVQIKVEPNFIIRGAAFSTEERLISPGLLQFTTENFSYPCLSFDDVFGGKICAALERQHPRDLFDIHFLLDNEGITEKLKYAFIFYLISSKRPYSEILAPNQKNIESIFLSKFSGMTQCHIAIAELSKTFLELRDLVQKSMTRSDIDFLVSTLELSPKWDSIPIKNLDKFPSVQWRMFNIEKMKKDKIKIEIETLEQIQHN